MYTVLEVHLAKKLEGQLVLIRDVLLLLLGDDVAAVNDLQICGRKFATESHRNNEVVLILCLLSELEQGDFSEDVVETCLPRVGLEHLSYILSCTIGSLVCAYNLVEVGRCEWMSHVLLQDIRPTHDQLDNAVAFARKR